MRIISGTHRGRKIQTVDSKKLRPTTGIAREAVFNILSHGQFSDLLKGCNVLDLFCGCGALAAESLSRGASKVVLIDIDQEHLDIARKNIAALGEEGNTTFIRADSSNPPPARFACDLVFLDPPYGKNFVQNALKGLINGGWLAKDAVLVIETGKKEDIDISDDFEELDDRVYGGSRVRIFRWR